MNNSNLLLDERPLQVLPSLAKKIGLNEAIILQQIHYWIKNKKNKGREHDGHKWVYNTYEEWQEDNFQFWSTSTIKRGFTNLEKAGLIFSKKIDKQKRDMTKFYRINYDAVGLLEETNLTSSINPKYPDVNKNTETTTETTKTGAKKQKSPERVSVTIEEAIFSGQDVPDELVGDNEKAKAKRLEADASNAAWIICQGQTHLAPLARAFMLARKIILPYDKKSQSGHRKALKSMYEAKPNGVRAEHVKSAVEKMISEGLMIKNLFSVQAFAIEAANPPPDQKEEVLRPKLKPYQEDGVSGIPNPKQ